MHPDDLEKFGNRCNREPCRFCEGGKCTDREQREECLKVLVDCLPDTQDAEVLIELTRKGDVYNGEE